MTNLFENITIKEKEGKGVSVRLAIRLQVAGNEVLCPVSRPCDSLEALERECRLLSEELERVKENCRRIFNPGPFSTRLHIAPDASPSDIWNALSALKDDEMVGSFNELEPSQRKAVAEHVLTRCNVFSGKGAVFSRRYDAETARME